MFQTLLDRPVKELALAGIGTMEAANQLSLRPICPTIIPVRGDGDAGETCVCYYSRGRSGRNFVRPETPHVGTDNSVTFRRRQLPAAEAAGISCEGS